MFNYARIAPTSCPSFQAAQRVGKKETLEIGFLGGGVAANSL